MVLYIHMQKCASHVEKSRDHGLTIFFRYANANWKSHSFPKQPKTYWKSTDCQDNQFGFSSNVQSDHTENRKILINRLYGIN